MIFWIDGIFTVLFMRTIASVTLFMARAMASWDLTVCSLRATAFRWLRNSMNFVIYVLVRTRSFAMILTGPIWPSFAYFLMSATNFCSCFSRLARSRSSSLTALLISRLFFLKTSLSGTFLPQVLPMACESHDVSRAAQARRNKPGAALLQQCDCGGVR